MPANTFFPDISEWQTASVLPAIPFIIIRATSGYRNDTRIAERIPISRRVNTARAWYAYLVRDVDPIVQTDRLLKAAPLVGPAENYMVDSENSPWAPWLSQAQRRDYTEIMLGKLLAVTGKPAIQYSGAWDLSQAPRTSKGPVISASYETPEPTGFHTAWQYSDGHYVSSGLYPIDWTGVGKCDTSVFRGTPAELIEAMTGHVVDKPPVKPPVKPGAPKPAFPRTPPTFQGRVLEVGVDGSDVRTWQQAMKDRGREIEVDGLYGAASKTSCENFQKKFGLFKDGRVGKITWDATWEKPIT